jgi:selenocysteine lyase/cysteine desulfurase
MELDRRNLLIGLGSATLASATMTAKATPTALPDRTSFPIDGINLNAAFTHPIGLHTQAAIGAYAANRGQDGRRSWPRDNPRDAAVARYAALIHADPAEIAVAPSTLEGENLVAAALGLGPGRGVVTDTLHYDAAIAMYGEMGKRGMPLTVLEPVDNRIDYAALDRAITPQTKLVALSLVSSPTGYMHDLKRVCAIAHAKGAMVYADIIQAVGAIPFDVKDSGVDFACAGAYKWLMGEFGLAFLYVRPDRLADLSRSQLGWRGLKSYNTISLPFDPPAPPGGTWELRTDTAGLFEVSTPNWGGLAATLASIDYILSIGVEAIHAHRLPMLARLREELGKAGYAALTPADAQGPCLVFAKLGLKARYGEEIKAANIQVSTYAHRIRIAPSVHNDMKDIDTLLAILTRA